MQISKEEEVADGDDDDFDDNASVITAVTATSGDRVGGAFAAAGGAAAATGELKTLFGVDAEGTGTGDPAEVVHFVSSSQRADRVRGEIK